jgi:hypothetical protein
MDAGCSWQIEAVVTALARAAGAKAGAGGCPGTAERNLRRMRLRS